MKFYFVAIICYLMISIRANSQDSTMRKFKFGINVSESLLNFGGEVTDFGFMIGKGRSEVLAGLFVDFNVDPGSSKNVVGLHESYRFFPSLRNKRVNFYFLYEFRFEKYSYHYSFFGLPNGSATKTITDVKHFLGYGCDYRLFTNFFVSSGIEFGAYHTSQTIIYDDNIKPSFTAKDWYYGVFLVKVGLTYIFNGK